MEKTRKSKFFGFKSRVETYECSANSTNSTLCVQEVNDLQKLPISSDVLPTSPMLAVSRANKVNHSPVGLTSPQFLVGWNDGASKNDIDMNSPVRSIPVQRRIRRCPDSFLFKAPINKTKEDGDGAILQCIDWAKNLFESTNLDKDNSTSEEKNVTVSKNVTNDNGFDILDDSVDEVMVLCSQAVEESIPSSKLSPDIILSSNSCKKHSLSSGESFSHSKRLKSDNELTKIEEVQKSSKLNCNNNNIVSSSNFNFKHPKMFTAKSSNSTNTKISNSAASVVIPSRVSRQDPITSPLDDDDDDELFGSFDFHSLDTLQKNHSTSASTKLFGSSDCNTAVPPKMISPRNSFAPKPVIKYTKEQIEQRRLEAKKRLMFNKKHKSM